jgi:hypothetical protein
MAVRLDRQGLFRSLAAPFTILTPRPSSASPEPTSRRHIGAKSAVRGQTRRGPRRPLRGAGIAADLAADQPAIDDLTARGGHRSPSARKPRGSTRGRCRRGGRKESGPAASREHDSPRPPGRRCQRSGW